MPGTASASSYAGRRRAQIARDGALVVLRIDHCSGQAGTDDAMRRIIEMSAPFAAFPPDLRHRYDGVDITREWRFAGRRPRMTGW